MQRLGPGRETETCADVHSQMVVENRAESDSSHLFPDYSQQIADRTAVALGIDSALRTRGPFTHNCQYAGYICWMLGPPTPPTSGDDDAAEPRPTSVARVDALLAEFRRYYPDALAVSRGLAERRGEPGLDWPDWCWLPMAGTVAYLSAHANWDGGRGADIGRVAALTQWRLGRGVYQIDPDVAAAAVDALRHSAGGGATQWRQAVLPPVQTWTRLPEWCCYVELPAELYDRLEDGFRFLGSFVHLEFDTNSGRPELRLVLDMDGTWVGLLPIPVYLDRPTLGSAVADMSANADAAAAGKVGADVRSLQDASYEAQLTGMAVWMMLPVVLALVDPAVRIVGDAGQQSAVDGGGGWRPAASTRLHRVSYRAPTLKSV